MAPPPELAGRDGIFEAARERRTVLVLFIDELQYVPEEQLAALITALHRCAQWQLPITRVGAGLPQLVGQMGRAKSYADARQAITAPARLRPRVAPK